MKWFNFLDHKLPDDEVQQLMESLPEYQKIDKIFVVILFSVLCSIIGLSVFYVASKEIKFPEVFIITKTKNTTNNQLKSFEAVGSINGEQYSIKKMPALRFPLQSPTIIKSLAQKIIQKAYSFDHTNVDQQSERLRPLFAKSSWGLYEKILNDSDLYKEVKDKNLIVSVIPLGEPIILSKALEKTGEEFAWKVVCPVAINYIGDIPGGTKTDFVDVYMTILRQDPADNPIGVAVLSFNPKPNPRKSF